MRVFFFAVTASILWPVPLLADEPRDTTATVAAWNIFGLRTINSARLDNLAKGIVMLDAEVVVLSEVKPDSIMAELIDKMGKLGANYTHAIKDQTASLNLAILHKAGVTVQNARFVPGSNIGNSGLRKALVADVRIGEFDFLLIGVHLKSGRGDDEQETRSKQCLKITEFVASELAGVEKDVLIIGDYNMIPERDGDNFTSLERDFDVRFISSDIKFPDFTHIGSGGSPGNFLDGFAVSQGHTNEYVETSCRVIEMHKVLDKSLQAYRSSVTDHLPIVARFCITEDDDQ